MGHIYLQRRKNPKIILKNPLTSAAIYTIIKSTIRLGQWGKCTLFWVPVIAACPSRCVGAWCTRRCSKAAAVSPVSGPAKRLSCLRVLPKKRSPQCALSNSALCILQAFPGFPGGSAHGYFKNRAALYAFCVRRPSRNIQERGNA